MCHTGLVQHIVVCGLRDVVCVRRCWVGKHAAWVVVRLNQRSQSLVVGSCMENEAATGWSRESVLAVVGLSSSTLSKDIRRRG